MHLFNTRPVSETPHCTFRSLKAEGRPSFAAENRAVGTRRRWSLAAKNAGGYVDVKRVRPLWKALVRFAHAILIGLEALKPIELKPERRLKP